MKVVGVTTKPFLPQLPSTIFFLYGTVSYDRNKTTFRSLVSASDCFLIRVFDRSHLRHCLFSATIQRVWFFSISIRVTSAWRSIFKCYYNTKDKTHVFLGRETFTFSSVSVLQHLHGGFRFCFLLFCFEDHLMDCLSDSQRHCEVLTGGV